jgi:hypothetical protein
MQFTTWYILLCAIALVNVLFFCFQWRRTANPSTSYQQTLRLLAIPWVFECTYRAVFPSLYLQRFVVWDTMFNSIIVDRTLACMGELAWTAQFAVIVSHLDIQLGKKKWVQACAYLAVIIYVIAECISYYNTATTNELWAAREVITDGIAFFFFFPATVSLLIRQKSYKWRYAKYYSALLCVTALVYPAYNIVVDSKMYMKRYAEDQAHNKTYFKFIPGLEDATYRRVPTHKTLDWSGDMTWMLVYFSVACWSGIGMMSPPNVVPSTRILKSINGTTCHGAPLLSSEKLIFHNV